MDLGAGRDDEPIAVPNAGPADRPFHPRRWSMYASFRGRPGGFESSNVSVHPSTTSATASPNWLRMFVEARPFPTVLRGIVQERPG